jgi:hypothetical protein
MAKIKDTLLLIPDEELRGWIEAFLVRNYGEYSLQNDVETWYNELGLVLHKQPFSAVSTGKGGLTIQAVTSYVAYDDFQGTSKYLICLYGLICKLTQIVLDTK